MMECPRCKEIELECFAKYLHGKKVWAEYECLSCGHYEQLPDRHDKHEEFFKGYNSEVPPRGGL